MAERTPLVRVGGYLKDLPAGDTVAGGGGSSARTVTAKTADYTVLAGDSGTVFTNSGAAGDVTLTLPASAGCTSGSTYFTFQALSDAGQFIIAVPGSDHLYCYTTSTGVMNITGGGGIINNNQIGGQMTVLYVGGGVWSATSITDNWIA